MIFDIHYHPLLLSLQETSSHNMLFLVLFIADVFEDTAPFATSVIDGYNVCIFAYGQTGTGKTFTMEGTPDNRGVNYRTLKNLFEIMKERENRYSYEISVSVLEVYNEQIRDLLVPASQNASTAKRYIRFVDSRACKLRGSLDSLIIIWCFSKDNK